MGERKGGKGKEKGPAWAVKISPPRALGQAWEPKETKLGLETRGKGTCGLAKEGKKERKRREGKLDSGTERATGPRRRRGKREKMEEGEAVSWLGWCDWAELGSILLTGIDPESWSTCLNFL